MLSVDVEVVNVTATVIDGSGRHVEGLIANDFQLLEDGREQKVAFFSHDIQPVSIGVLIDISGSLQDKLRQGVEVVNEIAGTLSSADEMFIITFNSRAEVRQKFTSNRDEIQASLRNIRASGETAVFDAISLGLREMENARHKKRILLLLTDGFDTRSKIKAGQAEDLLKRSGILVYAIGIDDNDNDPRIRKRPRYHIYEYMLGKLTSAGSGRLIRLYTGYDYDLRRLAEDLLSELHQEYTLGYYPDEGPENTSWRSIEVRVTRPGARVLGEKLHFRHRDQSRR